MRNATRIVVVLVVLALSTTTHPARAANVDVRFGVSVGHYAPGTCIVTVAQGASGLTVMNAAVTKGCIAGYQMDGSWLRCVTVKATVGPICSDVHEDPFSDATHYWAIYEDLGAVAPHALSGFSAGDATDHSRAQGNVAVEHTELVVAYESWAKCLAYPALCNPAL